MTLTVAKNAGFCYGVKRAVELAESLAGETEVNTIGPIIHNSDVVERLAKKGIVPVRSPSEVKTHAVISSHGAAQSVIDEIKERGLGFTDATCPSVAKIHRTVEEKSLEGYSVIIAGDESHPEIIGIKGHVYGKCYIIKNCEDVIKLQDILSENEKNKLIMVSQTTLGVTIWREIKEIVQKLYTKTKIFDTICNATQNRQTEAEALAKKSALMIVIGGRNSNNTKKLAEICGNYCKTIHIERSDELGKELGKNHGENASEKPGADIIKGIGQDAAISITAGASTPADIIKEVTQRMSEIINNEEFNFEEMLDQSFKRVYIGNRVKATVVAFKGNETVVDVGTKHSGYIPIDELTAVSGLKPQEIVSIGDEIDAVVLAINDAEGFITLSKRKIDAAIGMENLIKANENNEVITGTVNTVVNGGIIVLCDGVRVFVPASLSGTRRDSKLDDLLHKEVSLKIIEINESRGRVVGSIKLAQKEKSDEARAKFWAEVEEGKRYTGAVKSIESYGVFVDLGGVDGMVHVSELTWDRIKHPKEFVGIGDQIDVYIKSIDREKKRISLGAKDPEANPWNKFVAEYSVGDTVKVTIMSLTPFGAFAQIIPGIDGLIHISQISLERIANAHEVLKTGQEVDARIIEINSENNRVSLSIKVLLEEAKAAEQTGDSDIKIEGVEITSDEDKTTVKKSAEDEIAE